MSQPIRHDLLTDPARKLPIVGGQKVTLKKADIVPVGRRDAVPLVRENVGSETCVMIVKCYN